MVEIFSSASLVQIHIVMANLSGKDVISFKIWLYFVKASGNSRANDVITVLKFQLKFVFVFAKNCFCFSL